MSQEQLSDVLTEYIMMSTYGLRPYTDEQSIAYFSRMPSKLLAEILKLCEDLEEYEFCDYIFTAIKKNEVYNYADNSDYSLRAITD